MDLEQSIEIARSPADVYAFVATDHATNHPRWDPAILDMRQETPGPVAVGTEFSLDRKMMGRKTSSEQGGALKRHSRTLAHTGLSSRGHLPGALTSRVGQDILRRPDHPSTSDKGPQWPSRDGTANEEVEMAGVEKRDFDSPDETRTPDSCQHRHIGVVQSGTMRVTHEDGTVLELGPGDAYVIEPGHDAEVLGEERFVGFEFEQKAAEEYARQ